jgi:hypothetical protein
MFLIDLLKYGKSPKKPVEPKTVFEDHSKLVTRLIKDFQLKLRKAGKSENQKKQYTSQFLHAGHEEKSVVFSLNGKNIVAGLEWEDLSHFSGSKTSLLKRYLEKIEVKHNHIVNGCIGFQPDIYFKNKRVKQQRTLSFAAMLAQLRETKMDAVRSVSKSINLVPSSMSGAGRVLKYEIYLLPIPNSNSTAMCGFDQRGKPVSFFDTTFETNAKDQHFKTLSTSLKIFSEQTQCSIEVTKREFTIAEIEKLATPDLIKSIHYSNTANQELTYVGIMMFFIGLFLAGGGVWYYADVEEQKNLAIAHAEESARLAKQREQEEIKRKKQLVIDAKASLDQIRLAPDANYFYGAVLLANLSILPKSISENRGSDAWNLQNWSCETSKTMVSESQQPMANCLSLYKGEPFASVDLFYNYVGKALNDNKDVKFLFRNLDIVYQADNNLMAMTYLIPLEMPSNKIEYLQHGDTMRQLQGLRGDLRLSNFPFTYVDAGILPMDNTEYREVLLIKNRADEFVFPYGQVNWSFSASINAIRSSGAFAFPDTFSINKISGDTQKLSVEGTTYYE